MRTLFSFQEKSDNKKVFEQGSLALKYGQDNEFELVFVVGYQKMLPLSYLDKLLDDVQKRFRDRYAQELKEIAYQANFNDFTDEFQVILKRAEKTSQAEKIQISNTMRSFDQVISVFQINILFLIGV